MASNNDNNNRLRDLRSLLQSTSNNQQNSSSSRRRPRLPPGGVGMRNSSQVFKKTVCLLASNSDRTVPLQKKKLKLYLSKNIIEAVPIRLNYSKHEMLAYFRRLFLDKLGTANISIMINVGGNLVSPNLMPGEELTAVALKEVTGSTKYVYLFPSKDLGSNPVQSDNSDNISLSDDDLPSVLDDDDYVEVIEPVALSPPLQPQLPILPASHLQPASQPQPATQMSETQNTASNEVASNIQSENKPKPEKVALEEALELVRQLGVDDGKEMLQRFVSTLTANAGGRGLEITSLTRAVEDGKTNNIAVYRNDLLKSGAQELLDLMDDSAFDCRWPLEVDFIGEGSSDFGGPRKEFFQLMLIEVRETLVDAGLLFEMEVHLKNKLYYAVGALLGLCLYQRGPIPRLGIDLSRTVTSSEKQLHEGMQRVGLVQLLKNKPIHDLLHTTMSDQKLTSRSFQRLFRLSLSPSGSSRHHVELEAHKQFVRYCKEVQGWDLGVDMRLPAVAKSVINILTGRRLDGNLSLNKMLQFVTGSYEEPLLGFSIRPSIEFVEHPPAFLPKANTCGNLLTLPRVKPLESPLGDLELFSIFDHAFAQEYFGLA